MNDNKPTKPISDAKLIAILIAVSILWFLIPFMDIPHLIIRLIN
jgi:hypothetical protein